MASLGLLPSGEKERAPKGIWLGYVGVVASLAVLVIWAGLWLAATSPSPGWRPAGGAGENFLNFVRSSPTFDILLMVAMFVILTLSSAGIFLKRLGGAPRETSVDQPDATGTSPRPEESEDEQR